MRITCLITVCAYLSSTVSTEEIQYLNRLKKTGSQEELVFDAKSRKEINPNIGIQPDVFSILQISRPQEQINIQKPYYRKVRQSQPRPLQPLQQYPLDSSRRPLKRLKVRSIAGYEVNENEVHEFIQESIPEEHDDGPIYIKPVVRVTKKNLFDSVLEILDQLLNPGKKELGPIVGPIKMPGSTRKIFLRLMEPVDSSHINVRFVTQVPVPVVDEKSILGSELKSAFPFISNNPTTTLFNTLPVGSIGNDATFSSSNRHQVQLPRNATRSGKGRKGPIKTQLKPATKPKNPSQNLEESNQENVSPVKVVAASGAESDKNHLYYQYQSGDDAMKQVTEIIKSEETKHEQSLKNSLEPYQLSIHRLPLRQVAPLYPLSAMEHTDSSSYENTYKVPSDSLTVPSQAHSSSYEQYSNANAGSVVYDQSYTIPNTYSTTYQKQNEFSNAPSSYSISYQNQNEFNNAPSSTSYVKQNDLFNAPTTYTSSYEKPTNVPPPPPITYPTSHETQNIVQAASNSQDALRIIDPPAYIPEPRQLSGNQASNVFEHPMIPRQRYNFPNEIGSLPRNNAQNGELSNDQVTWGKPKRERSETNFPKNESNFQKSVEITTDDNREKWHPLAFVAEDADWHKAFANLAKVANDNRDEIVGREQLVNRPRQTSRNTTPSTIEKERINQRQSNKRRKPSVAATRSPRCLPSDKGDRCEQTEATTASALHAERIVMEEQVQTVADIEPVVITPKPIASSTVESLRLNATKSSWIEEPLPLVMTTDNPATTSATEKSSSLIKAIKSTTGKSVEGKVTSRSMMSNLIEKSVASSTTERSTSGTSEAPISNDTTKRLRLPKRPMIMKKPSFVLKRSDSDSTTRKTVASTTTRKPTTKTTKTTAESSTEKAKTRRSKYRSAIAKTSTT